MVLSGSVCCETDGVAIVDNLTAEMEASSNWQMTKSQAYDGTCHYLLMFRVI